MNKTQRYIIQECINTLSEIMDEEQDKFDNAPENLQGTEQYEKFEENAEQIQEAIDILEEVIE